MLLARMAWFSFSTEEPQSSEVLSDSTRRKKTHTRKTTPIIISAHDDDSLDSSWASLPSQPGLVSFIEKTGMPYAHGDNVVRDGSFEIREPSSSQWFYEEDSSRDSDIDDLFYDTPIFFKDERDSDIDDLFYDTAMVVKDESKSFDVGSRGDLICIVRPSSSSSLQEEQESSVLSESTDDEIAPVNTTQEDDEVAPQSSTPMQNDEQLAKTRAGGRRAIIFGKIASKATASCGKRISKVVAARLEFLKEKRRKTEEKIVSNQLHSLRSKRKKVAAHDQIRVVEVKQAALFDNEVVSTKPTSRNVKTSVENDGIELNLNDSRAEGEAADQSPLLKASSTLSAAPLFLEKQSDDQVSQSSHKQAVTPPSMMNTMEPGVSPRTIRVIPEPVASDLESDATKQTSRGWGDVSSLWSFITCCSFAYICWYNGDSSYEDSNVEGSVQPTTEEELEKNVSRLVKTDSSIAKNGSNANENQQNDRSKSQEDMSELMSPSKERNARKFSTESRDVVSRNFGRRASTSKLRIMESESSLAVRSKSDSETSYSCDEADLYDSPDADECKMMMTASLENTTSNEASIEQASSNVTEASDAMSGLSLIESDTDVTGVDSRDNSLPWWQEEELESSDSLSWDLPNVVDSDSELNAVVDGIWTVPTLTEYSQSDFTESGSQFTNLSFESDDDRTSTASSFESIGSIPDKSTSNDSASTVCDQGIERENGCNSFAAKANDGEKACEATDNSTKDTTDASRESHVNGDIREQKEPPGLMKTSTYSEHEGNSDKLDMWSVNETEISEGETSQCVERKRIRVFSKALSQSVARNIQRRASKMKAKKSARRNEALLIKSGFTVDEELPAIEEMNESSNASSTSSLGAETQVTCTRTGIEVDDGKIHRTSNAEELMCPPPESSSPKSVFDIKLPSEIELTHVSDHYMSMPSVTSSVDDASNGELEIYMI
jgi:hypothetical protein